MDTQHTPNFNDARVLIIGDIMLDRYWSGETSRISPEAPVPVVAIQSQRDCLGGAGNVACNTRALGAQTKLISVLGDDDIGHLLLTMLKDKDITADCLLSEQAASISKLRILSQHQQLLRLDFDESLQFDQHAFLAKIEQAISDCDVVILSDYGKGSLHDCQAIITLARAKQVPVLVDPKGSDFSRYRGATLITPNRKEFEAVVGPCSDEATLIAKAEQLMADIELDALLLTRSEEGMSLFQKDRAAITIPARAREVYDVTGAGDTVIAVTAACLAARCDLKEAVTLANVAASIVVGQLGTASVSQTELMRSVNALRATQSNILKANALDHIIGEAKSRGERIVFTNGCFDILHPGHVTYLKQAKTLGDRLIVALNDDASVKRLKGESRPINSLAKRAAVLAELACVDWVTDFSEDTPENLIKAIQPDVLVKGGDYVAESVVGYDFVTSYGGEVIILDFVDGCSTTKLIADIMEVNA